MAQSITWSAQIFANQPATQVVGGATQLVAMRKTQAGAESSFIMPASGLVRKIIDLWGTDGQHPVFIDMTVFAEATESPEWFTISNAITTDGPVPIVIPTNSIVGPGPAPQKMIEPECTYLRIRAQDPDHQIPRTLKARLKGYWSGEGDWNSRILIYPSNYAT
jgi:hypothetical protein